MTEAEKQLQEVNQFSAMMTQQGMIIAERVGLEIGAKLEVIVERMSQTVTAEMEAALEKKAEEAFARGLVAGVRLLLQEDREAEGDGDTSLLKKFWKTGYRELTTNASTGAQQWVGRKILIALVTAVFITSTVWLAKNGHLK